MNKSKRIKDIDLNRNHDLTIEELKESPFFKHFTDEQAANAINTLKRFTEIICLSYLKEKWKRKKMLKNTDNSKKRKKVEPIKR